MGEVSDGLTVRALGDDDDVRGFLRCMRAGFLSGPEVITDELIEWIRPRWDLDRTWSAFDDGVQCGTARTFPTRLRLPGGADVAVSALTQVTVLPTHTRRGHLGAMMRTQLDHAVVAGEVASILVAAEWPIYGRFGYGPAVRWSEHRVDSRRARVLGAPVGTVELVDAAGLRAEADAVHAAAHAAHPGEILRNGLWLDALCGTDPRPGEEVPPARRRVLHRDGDGVADGWVVYDPKDEWAGDVSRSTATVVDFMAATPTATRELWRYLVEIDLVVEVTWSGPLDSGLEHWLADGRAVRRPLTSDHVWVRLLDVPAALTARRYVAASDLILDVTDRFLDRGGRWRLDAGPDGATCEPAPGAAPDLTLDVAAVGSLWLGGIPVSHLATAGLVEEHRPGALAEAAALFSWPVAPDCSTDF